MGLVVRDAMIALAISVLLALSVNLIRPDGLEWIASRDYEILVPCPEPMGDATPLQPDNFWPAKKGDLLVDSRSAENFTKWHVPDAKNIPFDYLTEVSDEAIAEIAKSRSKRVIVIGDGQNPDTGELLARELSGRGIKNVLYLVGGIKKARIAVKGS